MGKTRGEMMLQGLEQVREGLELISQHGNKDTLMKTLVGSTASARRLREAVRDSTVFRSMALSMVCARNSRLNTETVEKVVCDFLDVIIDLSQPYKPETEELEGTEEGGGKDGEENERAG